MMDERFRTPIAIILWSLAILVIIFGLLFGYGLYLGFTQPI